MEKREMRKLKAVGGGDGRICDRKCKSAFNASVSNGIRRASKNPPSTRFSQKSRKQSSQRIILLQMHTLTSTGPFTPSLHTPPPTLRGEEKEIRRLTEEGGGGGTAWEKNALLK